MKLEKLLENLEYTLVQGSLDVEIEDIVYDSRKAEPGKLFMCIPGSKIDSHDFIPQVVEAGISAIVISKDVEVPGDVTVIRVEDSRIALNRMSCAVFDYPTKKLTAIGITGTKGKTTTTYMIKSILEAAGKKVGLIGTNGAVIDGETYKTVNTTPESYELQKYFSMMVDAGCEYMVMEVSSQGIMMHRVEGIDFDVCVFTNISPDHIGPNEHASFEEYLSYKAQIFTLCKEGIVCLDDPNYEGMIAGHTCNLRTFGINDKADYSASNIESIYTSDFMGMNFTYRGSKEYEVKLDIPGIFNIENALAAISVADTLGIDEEAVKKAMATVKVAGRMELAHVSEHCSVIIDYAHNGVSAQSMLKTLKEYNPKRLVVVFGCGGDRDPHRRYEMGEAVGELADLAVITTDNPRFEDPANIIKDIHIGLDPTGGKYIEILDRKEAIEKTIADCEEGDMIAIIGKGHEDYQEVCGARTHLSDAEEVEKTIKKLGW